MSDKNSDLETERFQALLTAAREYAKHETNLAAKYSPVTGGDARPRARDIAIAQAALVRALGELGAAAVEWAEMVAHRE